LNRPELTAERFIKHPFRNDPQARLYKTGDWVRYLTDGNIEFFGRTDDQVKIRGFRIEPGEIEAMLDQHPAIREAVVTVREDNPGDKRLIGYIVSSQQLRPTSDELTNYLRDIVPEYMIPSAFVSLDCLPLTPNGKVDRRALPAPGTVQDSKVNICAPRTAMKSVLSEYGVKF
jgi:acyl-coenzyme A synthetase/AMP-(fatty) acid ligase